MKQYDEILRDLIQIQSVNDHEEKVALYIQGLFEGKDQVTTDLVESFPGRSNIIVKVKGQAPGKIMAFSGHLDVVEAGEGWTHDPFGGEIVDGKMYGRGTSDMKGGVAASLYAILELIEEGRPFNGELWFLGTVGEEMRMDGAKDLVDGGYLDEVDAILIGEPSITDGRHTANFASKGAIQYAVHAQGKAAHSSMPWLGINALTTVTEFINEVQAKFDEVTADESLQNEHLGPTLNVFSMIQGGIQVNSVPDQVTVRGNIRTVPEFGTEDSLNVLREAIEANNQDETKAKLTLETTQVLDPAETAQDSDLVQALLAATDLEIDVIGLQATCELSRYGNISDDIQLLVFGPGLIANAHIVDEYIEMDEYYQSIGIYKQTALNFLGQ